MTEHPFRAPASTEAGLVKLTLLEAIVKRTVFALGPTESLGDFSFTIGEIPLALVHSATGYLYFYDADDTTTPDDGVTCLVTGNGLRYILADASAIAIASVLAVENDPPVSPAEGDAYVVDTAPTGDWAGYAKDIALYTKRGWVFAGPQIGCSLLNQDTGLNIQYSAAGVWGAMATALDVDAVTPDLMLFPFGVSVEAQQNAPPGSPATGLFYIVGTVPSGAWTGHENDVAYYTESATWAFIDAYDGAIVFNKATGTYLTWFDVLGAWKAPWPYQATCQGRLTLETGVAVSTTDQTAKATLYFTPFRGNHISLYPSGDWGLYEFSQLSLSLAGYTSGKPYDIFIYNNSGTLTLESLVWTNDTTRATALALQDGILVKSGDATRRYLGTIYTSATGQCEDSYAKRYVWNYYNRVARPMRQIPGGTWAYKATTIRQANASTANQLDFVRGVGEDAVEATLHGSVSYSGSGSDGQGTVGIGLDSTTAYSADATRGTAAGSSASTQAYSMAARYQGYPGVGKHSLVWLEQGNNGTPTMTWSGVSGGISGAVMG